MSFSQNQRRRWIAALVLGVYGTAGVLGYGLHALWHCEHCHEVAEHCHGGECGHHHHDYVAESCCHTHSLGLPGERLVQSEDDCLICAFLAQAQSEHAEEAPELITTISPAAPLASELSLLPDVVRLHLARGPPLA